MSGWELFTWFNVGVLTVGSVAVFVLFLRQLPRLLSPTRSDAEEHDPDDPRAS